MMSDVVADVPKRERRERRQERNSADDFVEPVVLGVAAVAGVVPDDEQSRDGDGSRNDHEGLGPPRVEVTGADDAGAEKGEVEQHPQHWHDRIATQVFLHGNAHRLAGIGTSGIGFGGFSHKLAKTIRSKRFHQRVPSQI
jgi:hypothetical protein